ncbi:LGFP repeat-containing protein [Nocardia sp. NPDC050406]|uniref:LGFP repeat-containing protein n=1 Tax=Nocardia sp. NPDC050406 TaxID=3364318 RepID=UPI0037B6D938
MSPLRRKNNSSLRGRSALALALAATAVTLTVNTAAARPIGAFEVGGAIEAEYDAAGGGAVFGEPSGPELDAARGGKYQEFDRNASIYWNPTDGAHAVAGFIRDKWRNLGSESGVLGYPVTREESTPANTGRFNHFQNGSIYWSVGAGAHQIGGVIRDKWGQAGWEGSPLGFPISDEAKTSKGEGRYNMFEGGVIYWSKATGAHIVWGAIRDQWVAAGGENGRYGLPKGDEYDYEGGKAQDFQGGKITWQPE